VIDKSRSRSVEYLFFARFQVKLEPGLTEENNSSPILADTTNNGHNNNNNGTATNNNNNNNNEGNRRSRVVHIRNIPSDVTETEIVHLGIPFGKVSNVLVLKVN